MKTQFAITILPNRATQIKPTTKPAMKSLFLGLARNQFLFLPLFSQISPIGNTFAFNNENRQNEGTQASRCQPSRLAR